MRGNPKGVNVTISINQEICDAPATNVADSVQQLVPRLLLRDLALQACSCRKPLLCTDGGNGEI